MIYSLCLIFFLLTHETQILQFFFSNSCTANQLAGFYMLVTLAFHELIIRLILPIIHDECQINKISKNH